MAEFPQSLIDIIKADTQAKPSPAASHKQIAEAEAEAGFSSLPVTSSSFCTSMAD